MAAFTLSEVVDANGSALPAGTIVSCEAGWQEYAALRVDDVARSTSAGRCATT